MSEERFAVLEAQVLELQDRIAITDLINRYAECIRYRDEMSHKALLCEDAWFELRHIDPLDSSKDTLIQRMEGSDAMVGGRDEVAGARTIMWPMIHAVTMTIDGDNARSVCLTETAMWPFGRTSIGEYRDTFRRTGDGWKFASRCYRLIGDSTGRFATESRAFHMSVKE